MTAKFSITVPDDVAVYLSQQPNVSAAVTAAVRSRMSSRERFEALMAAKGVVITDEGRARWRDLLARKEITPEMAAAARDRWRAAVVDSPVAQLAGEGE